MKKTLFPKHQQKNSENFAYVRFENQDALNSKRDFLSIQMLLLNSLKIEKNYKVYRIQELDAKKTFIKKMKSLKANISTLERALPKVKIPKDFEKSSPQSEINSKGQEAKKDRSIEDQLYEIQRKLNELQNNNL